jgi:EAL domain-containing protein (putative c-di-GMP-specific phosphodiesterase class I)
LSEATIIDKFRDWQIKISNGEIIPFFQPILSLETMRVYGFEALGRLRKEDKSIESMGGFFFLEELTKNEPNIINYFTKIDRILRTKAIEKFKLSIDNTQKLFINISPKQLVHYLKENRNFEREPETIKMVINSGIDPSRIVIEITEDSIDEDLEFLHPIIHRYKEFGFQIAIDDIGSKSSNLDRIAVLHPDIVKVDMQMLKKSLTNRNYEEILFSLSRVCESLGISLLFEGIETKQEIRKALEFGARYVQGYLFDKPEEELQDSLKYKNILEIHLNDYCISQYYEIQKRIGWEKEIEKLLGELQYLNDIDYQEKVEKIFKLDNTFYKFFLTDLLGYQISPNYIRENRKVVKEHDSKGKNWSWRPYFINHVYSSTKNPNDWVISVPYIDLSSKKIIKTFSKTISTNTIFFLDIEMN